MASTPAMKVVATAPMPGISTPSLPLGSIILTARLRMRSVLLPGKGNLRSNQRGWRTLAGTKWLCPCQAKSRDSACIFAFVSPIIWTWAEYSLRGHFRLTPELTCRFRTFWRENHGTDPPSKASPRFSGFLHQSQRLLTELRGDWKFLEGFFSGDGP